MVASIAAAWILLLKRVEPVPTWFYVFAWYPTLVLLDEIATARTGSPRLLSRRGFVLSVFGWSVPIWLLFELANFRLRNWYYVFLPVGPVERWIGIVLSFATVVPAVLLSARAVAPRRSPSVSPGFRMTVRGVDLRAAELTGLATGALALVWPTVFFPLIWGAVWLVADPYLYRRRPDWSLIGDLERGRLRRIGSLLAGGLLIGFLWEWYNYWARGKWFYTVPWLEDLKWFEMPPYGFLGFPFFALEAWTLYHALCAAGLAVAPASTSGSPPAGPEVPAGVPRRRPGRMVVLAAGAAVIFSAVTLLGMERLTISSVVPTLRAAPWVDRAVVERAHQVGLSSVFDVVELPPGDLARAVGISGAEAERLQAGLRLAVLRGIGVSHAAALFGVGIEDRCALARSRPDHLWRLLHRATGSPARPTLAEVRVWVRGARAGGDCPGD